MPAIVASLIMVAIVWSGVGFMLKAVVDHTTIGTAVSQSFTDGLHTLDRASRDLNRKLGL